MKIAVIAAHPDDEILGCGGTMAKHIASGDEVFVLILGEGISSRGGKHTKKKQLSLHLAARGANEVLGITHLTILGLPDNSLDTLPRLEVVQSIEKFLDHTNPSIVYTHSNSDLNIDHQIVHESVLTACRPTPESKIIRILCFEVPSSTEWRGAGSVVPFIPNWFVDISDTISLKIKALTCYSSEMKSWPHARSLEAVNHLCCWRGATIGSRAAEAFVLSRAIA